jgi:hypothetical protein
VSADPELCDVCGYPNGWDCHDECTASTSRPTWPEDEFEAHPPAGVAIPEEPLS